MQPNYLKKVHSACTEILDDSIEKLREKYRPVQYVSRNEPEAKFQRFAASDKQLFLVLGDSGYGKTNLMCHLAKLSDEMRPTLFLMGMWQAYSTIQEDIFEHVFGYLKTRSGYKDQEVWSFLRALDEDLVRENSFLLVIIDGINETEDTLWVKRGIRDLLMKTPNTIKFGLSCRTDSFRLHFQDSFWADFVYQEGSLPDAPDEPRPFEERLRAQANSRFNRMLTPEQRIAVEEALTKQRESQKLRRAKRLRELATGGSVFLGQFSEQEFSSALSRYEISATLVGEALENARNPLVFRFFAETIGREDREISEVFTLQNAHEYLRKHLNEMEVKGFERETAKTVLYAIANECWKQYLKGSLGVDDSKLATLNDRSLINSFVESGLLIVVGEARAIKIVFTFDQMLSYVLALEASEEGPAGIRKRLNELVKERNPPAIAFHLCTYLLLFNEESASLGPEHRQDSVRRFLNKPAYRPHIVRKLPEFQLWSAEAVSAEIKQLLTDSASFSRAGDKTYNSIRAQTLYGQAEANLSLVRACADALSTLARKGHGPGVITLIGEFLSRCPNEERTEVFYPLVTPITVSFNDDPDRCLQILQQLCDSERETDLEEMVTGPIEDVESLKYSYHRRYNQDGGHSGLSVLQNEISNFPQARGQLIQALADSNWAIFRSAAAMALAKLFVARRQESETLIAKLVDDGDFRVRVALSQTAQQLFDYDRARSSELCRRLLEDRDERVRAALVKLAVELSSQEQIAADFLLTDAISDESTYIRSVLATALIAKLGGQSLEPLTIDLFRTMLKILAKDRSYLVRTVIAKRVSESFRISPDFWIDLLTNSISDQTPASYKLIVIKALLEAPTHIGWGAIPVQTNTLAALLAGDKDYVVRARAVPLLAAMADDSDEVTTGLLARLLDDPEIVVRLEALRANRSGQFKVLSQLIVKAGETTYSPPQARWMELAYVDSLTNAKIAALSGHELIERILRNVGAAGLLLPFVAVIGLEGWKISWLGYASDGSYTSSPLHSSAPIIVGIFMATAVLHIQRWLDLRYYSRRMVTVLKAAWAYLLVPILASVAAGAVTSRFAGFRLGLLFGIITLTIGLNIGSLIVGRRFRLSSAPWSALSITYMIAVGYFSGLVGGWLAELTREGFYGFFMLICPLLLTLRWRPKYQTALYGILAGALPASVIPVLASGISQTGFTKGGLYQFLAQHFGNPVPAAAIISTATAALVAGVILVDASWVVGRQLLLFWMTVILPIGVAVLLTRVFSLKDVLLWSLFELAAMLLVWVFITEREQTWQPVVWAIPCFLIGSYGQSFIASPWLLPGLTALGIGVGFLLWWSCEDQTPDNEDQTPDIYRVRKSVRLAFIAVPAISSLALLTASALSYIKAVNVAVPFTYLSVAVALMFGFLGLYFNSEIDLRFYSRLLDHSILACLSTGIAVCGGLIFFGHQRQLAVVFAALVLLCLALVGRSVWNRQNVVPVVVALVFAPSLILIMISHNISAYLGYAGFFGLLLVLFAALKGGAKYSSA